VELGADRGVVESSDDCWEEISYAVAYNDAPYDEVKSKLDYHAYIL
jgi:hypothetical protein